MPVAAQGQLKVRRRAERVPEVGARRAMAQIQFLVIRFARQLGPAMVRDDSAADGRWIGGSDGKLSNSRRDPHGGGRRCPRPLRASGARAALPVRRDIELICVYARAEGWQNTAALSYTEMAIRC